VVSGGVGTRPIFGRGWLVAVLLAMPACAAAFGIDEKHLEGDAGAVVDAVASADASGVSADGATHDAAPEAVEDADGAGDVSVGAADVTAPPPAADAAPVSTDATAREAAAPPPVPDAAEPVEAAPPPPPPPSCNTCQPANVVTVLCIAGVTCNYDGCASFPGGGTYLDCDGDRSNGCEASPDDPATCGSCSNACKGARDCAMRNGTFACKGGGNGNGNGQ
jgi:hypothetical protein